MSSTATVMTTTAKPWAEREHPFSPSYLPLDKAFRVYARHGKQQDPRPELTPRTRSTVSSKDPSAPVVSFTKEPMSAVVPTHKDPGTLTTSRKSFQHLGLELNTWDDFLWRWNVWIQSNTCLYVMYPGEQLFFLGSILLVILLLTHAFIWGAPEYVHTIYNRGLYYIFGLGSKSMST